MIGNSSQVASIRAIPLSPVQLARRAEELPEFVEFMKELFGLEERPESHYDLVSYGEDGVSEQDLEEQLGIEQEFWDDEFAQVRSKVSSLLRRSGYYHALASGNKESKKFYSLICQHLFADEVALLRFYLLDGCAFASNHFEVAGFPVARLSGKEIAALGPPNDVRRDFFPSERIGVNDLSKFALSWFVRTQSKVPTSSAPLLLNDLEKAPRIEGRQQIMLPVLFLSLYHRAPFEVSRVLVSEPGWRVEIWRVAAAQRESTQSTYSVPPDKQPDFEDYLKIVDRGFRNAKAADIKSKKDFITTAAYRYLQATFPKDDVLADWEIGSLIAEPGEIYALPDSERVYATQSALLHYIFSLESLLTGDSREALTEKIALSTALIVGREDSEKVAIRRFMKKAYRYRSEFAHGNRGDPGEVSKVLPRLRVICQRMLLVVLSLYGENAAFDFDTLQDLAVSNELQSIIGEARCRIFSLIADNSPVSES
jgi:hypothetical protein